MLRKFLAVAFLVTLICLSATLTLAQFGGSRAGKEFEGGVAGLSPLERETAESYITVDGRAELRAKPTAVRVVLAVTAEAENAEGCQKLVE
jgi:hypothetical protein